MNIKADELASSARSDISTGKIQPTQYSFPAGVVSLKRDNRLISSQETHILRWRYSEFQLQEYYVRFFKVPRRKLHNVNWAGLKLARNRMPIGAQTFSIKHMIDWLPTGFKLRQFGKEITNCHLCNAPGEDADHLWKCPSRSIQNVTIISQFRDFLGEIDTDPIIARIFAHKVSIWLIDRKDRITDEMPEIQEKA